MNRIRIGKSRPNHQRFGFKFLVKLTPNAGLFVFLVTSLVPIIMEHGLNSILDSISLQNYVMPLGHPRGIGEMKQGEISEVKTLTAIYSKPPPHLLLLSPTERYCCVPFPKQ